MKYSALLTRFKNNIKWSYHILFISVSLPLIAHGYLGIFSRYYADNFCFQVQLRSKGIIGSAIYYYNEITGRFPLLLFEQFTAGFNTNILYGSYTFLSIWFILLTLVIYLILKNGRLNLLSAMLIASTILVVTIDLIPNMYYRRTIDALSHTWDPYPGIFQSLYWISGRNRMIIPLILGTIITGLIFHYQQKDYNFKHKIFFNFVLAFLAFFAGGFGETYVVLQTVTLALIFVFIIFILQPELKQKLFLPIGVSLFFSILSILVILIAPGNENRFEYFTQPKGILELLLISWQSMVFMLKDIFKWPGNILSVFQLMVIAFYLGANLKDLAYLNNYHSIIKKSVLIIPVIIVVTLFSSFLPAAYGTSIPPPARVMIGPIYFTICLLGVWGFLLGKLLKYKINLQKRLVIKILTVFFFCLFFINGIRDAQKILQYRNKLISFSIAYDEREERIQEAKLMDKEIVIVPPITHFIGGASLSVDSTFWINECISDYYGIKVLSASN